MAQFKCPECGAIDDNVEGPAPICNGFGVNVGATDREREGYHVATTMERSGGSGGEKKSTAKRSTSKRSGSRRKASTAKTRRTTSSATRSGTRTAGGRSGRAGESA